MTKEEWLAWQKQIIREEYKDIKPASEKAVNQFNRTVKQSLEQVSRND